MAEQSTTLHEEGSNSTQIADEGGGCKQETITLISVLAGDNDAH